MLRALASALVLAAACSAASPAPPNDAERKASAPSASASAASSANPATGLVAGSSSVLVTPGAGRGSLVLDLPASSAFMGAALPASRPERYRSFAQASRIHVGRSHLRQVDLFPGEAWLLAVSDDEATVRVYERASARLVGNHPVAGFRRFETGGVLAWPETPPRFVVSSGEGLLLYDARTGSALATLAREKLLDLRFSPDRTLLVGREAAPPEGSSKLHFYARGTAGSAPGVRALGVLAFSERVDAWDLSSDHRLLAAALYPSGDLLVLDLKSGTPVLRVPGPDFGGDVAFSPDGRFVAMGGQGLLLVDLLNEARR
ncbi:MAG TPA: hypothetical protein VFZ53_27215, partial [Polyangiaceae bacterium]